MDANGWPLTVVSKKTDMVVTEIVPVVGTADQVKEEVPVKKQSECRSFLCFFFSLS